LTRGGKEPAEDVKRAIHRAIELAGLEAQEVRMLKASQLDRRIILGDARPAGWPYKSSAISIMTFVAFSEAVGKAEIRCLASDGDPIVHCFTAPLLPGCRSQLSDLPPTLKEVWIARRKVIARVQAGETGPIFDRQ
jgi:hypothetical protein